MGVGPNFTPIMGSDQAIQLELENLRVNDELSNNNGNLYIAIPEGHMYLIHNGQNYRIFNNNYGTITIDKSEKNTITITPTNGVEATPIRSLYIDVNNLNEGETLKLSIPGVEEPIEIPGLENSIGAIVEMNFFDKENPIKIYPKNEYKYIWDIDNITQDSARYEERISNYQGPNDTEKDLRFWRFSMSGDGFYTSFQPPEDTIPVGIHSNRNYSKEEIISQTDPIHYGFDETSLLLKQNARLIYVAPMTQEEIQEYLDSNASDTSETSKPSIGDKIFNELFKEEQPLEIYIECRDSEPVNYGENDLEIKNDILKNIQNGIDAASLKTITVANENATSSMKITYYHGAQGLLEVTTEYIKSLIHDAGLDEILNGLQETDEWQSAFRWKPFIDQ